MSYHPRAASENEPRYPVSSVSLRALIWGLSLFSGIVVAGTQLYPGWSGRIILGMMAGGFFLFAIAKATKTPSNGESPDDTASLQTPMKILYWSGYTLMVSALMLTVLAILFL